MPSQYHILGPFPIGQREIGSDVMESFEGSVDLAWQLYMNETASRRRWYPSELGDGGRVYWKSISPTRKKRKARNVVVNENENVENVNVKNVKNVKNDIDGNSGDGDGDDEIEVFDDQVVIQYSEKEDGVRWNMMTDAYGMVGSMFYSWIYAQFDVHVAGKVLVNCVSCTVFTIDDNRDFIGDIYGIGYGWNVVQLSVGRHTIRIRKNAMESATIRLQFQNLTNSQYFVKDDYIVPTKIDSSDGSGGGGGDGDGDRHTFGTYFSIPVLNTGDAVMQQFKVSVVDERKEVKLANFVASPIIYPGQTALLQFRVLNIDDSSSLLVNINTDKGLIQPMSFNISLAVVQPSEPFMFTYVDMDKSVQYAMAVPPKQSCKSMYNGKCPIIIATHGAGSRAEWLIGYYGQFDYAWIVAPSGRRRFGYDWTGPQMNNVHSALRALQESLSTKQLEERMPNTDRLFYTGHSMGGHGCFLISTMYPDQALGSMCVSGWTTHHQYVPYFTRNDISFTDSILKGLLESAIYEHNPDLHMENMKGVPLMTRTGAIDDNVSPWHPRRMARIHAQISGNASQSLVSEIPGVGHWWDTIMNDQDTRKFMTPYLNPNSTVKPPLPTTFTVTCMNPRGFGGKGGVVPLQLTIPFRIGKIRVFRSSSSEWWLRTSNIRRFSIKSVNGLETPSAVRIDQSDPLPVKPSTHFCKEDSTGDWKICEGVAWTYYERSAANYGPMRIVFEKFAVIVIGTQGTATETMWHEKQAILLSNQLYIVGRHYIPIIRDSDFVTSEYSDSDANLILIGGPHTNLVSQYFAKYFPVRFHTNRSQMSLGDYVFSSRSHSGEENPLGCLFLSALPNIAVPGPGSVLSRLALVVAGTSMEGAQLAARMIPVSSGLHIPDYLIVTKDIKSRGSGGIVAAGYWNNFWGFDLTSAYVDEIHSTSSPTNIIVPPGPSDKTSTGKLVSSLVTIGVLLGFSLCGMCWFLACQPIRKKPLLLDEPILFTIDSEMKLDTFQMGGEHASALPGTPLEHHDVNLPSESSSSMGNTTRTRHINRRRDFFISPMSLSPAEEDSDEDSDEFQDTISHRPTTAGVQHVTTGASATSPPPNPNEEIPSSSSHHT